MTKGYNVPTRQGIKSNRSKLRRLLSEKQSRKTVEHCEKGLCGSGAKSASIINGCKPSDVIKKSDVVLFVSRAVHQKATPYKRLGSMTAIGYYNTLVRTMSWLLTSIMLRALILYVSGGTYRLKSTPNERFLLWNFYRQFYFPLEFLPEICCQEVTEEIFFF